MRSTRRAALTAYGAAALALTGCTASGSSPSDAGTSAAVTDGASGSPTATPDPDRVALDRATALTTSLLDEAVAAGPLVDPAGGLAALHTAHLAALTEASPDEPTATAGPTRVPDVRPGKQTGRRLRRHEAAGQRELAQLARDAESGALARLFASMSAGIAAHLAALPPRAAP